MSDKLESIERQLEKEESPQERQRLFLERERAQEQQFKASIARRAKLAKRAKGGK